MSRRSRGFRAAKNYDPGRNPRNAKRRAAGKDTERRDESRIKKSARRSPTREIQPAKVQATLVPAKPSVGVKFEDIGIGGNLRKALTDLGVDVPFAIQESTIPPIIAGKNVLGRAETGSGKTVAFGAGIVERIMLLQKTGEIKKRPSKTKLERGKTARKQTSGSGARAPKAIILAPTRELAMQIDETVQPLARSVGLFTAQLVGGLAREPQINALKRGIDIVIGTPGRVEDFIEHGQLDLREVKVAVVDEADHMADLGFIEPVQRILGGLRRGFQTLLFSATLDTSVRQLVSEFMADFVAFEVEPEARGSVKHSVFVTLREEKLELLKELAKNARRAIFFVRTKGYAEILTEEFRAAGVNAVSLHGDLSQNKRIGAMQRFHSRRADVLVATDVAARGIHVDDVSLVVQADVPDDFKTYLHRAGRTGRAGASGSVITLIPRTAQKRTREILENAEIEPDFFENVFVENIQVVLGKLK